MTIVGADRLPDSGYMRAKVAQEGEIEAGPVPYTILRATQFFEFLSEIAEAGAEGDRIRLSTGLSQPVAVDEVAATVAELATGEPVGGRVELGGPRRWASTPGRGGCSPPQGTSGRSSATCTRATSAPSSRGGELTPGAGARIGTTDFDAWFAAQPQRAGRRPG